MLARNHRASLRFSQLVELLLQSSWVGEFEKAYAIHPGAYNKRPQGTFDPIDDDAIGALALPGRFAEGLPKGFAKTTGRLIAVRPSDMIGANALADIEQCRSHTSSPAEGLKGHTVILAKVSADARRLDAQISESGIRQAIGAVTINLLQ